MTHTSGPAEPKTINSALRHQCGYVIQFKIIIILITTFSQCSRYKYTASVTPHITFLIVIQLYWYHELSDANRLGWTAFFGFVS